MTEATQETGGPGTAATTGAGLAAHVKPPRPQGRYVAAVVDGGIAVSAGMTPRADGRLTVRGPVGSDVDAETARQAAGLAARNALAAVVEALPDGSRLRRCLRMTVYVACAEGFTELSAVADGASDALADALAEHFADAAPVAGDDATAGGQTNTPVTIGLSARSAADLPAGSAPALPARSAIGVRSLPSGAPVEVELTASIEQLGNGRLRDEQLRDEPPDGRRG